VAPVLPTFADRTDAGQRLAALLAAHAGHPDVLVLGLPRGGVPVAYQVAAGLGVPMDVYVVRKLGTPAHPELAFGAVAAGGVRVLNPDVVAAARLSVRELDEVTAREAGLVEECQRSYRGDRAPLELEGKTLVLVDDGLATGATMRAVVMAVRQHRPARVVVAVPVASRLARDELGGQADEVVCVAVPDPLRAVGAWYVDFSQTTDEEVRRLLAAAPGPEGGRKGLMASIPPQRPTIPAEEVPEADALEQAMFVLADEDDDRR